VGVFLHFWPSLPGPGRQPNGPFLSQVSLKIRLKSTFLETTLKPTFILEFNWNQNFGSKNKKLGKNSTSTNADPGYIISILYRAITRRHIKLESCSNPLKMGKVFWLARKKLFQFWMSFFCLCLHDGRMFMYIRFTF